MTVSSNSGSGSSSGSGGSSTLATCCVSTSQAAAADPLRHGRWWLVVGCWLLVGVPVEGRASNNGRAGGVITVVTLLTDQKI